MPGVFEEARGGTVLLDEIGELPLPLQAKLLGVLERREATRIGSNTPVKLDIRLIAATHRNPNRMAKCGEFRADLLYRIAEFTLRVPALRERKQDIGAIAQEIMRRDGHVGVLCPDAIKYLEEQSWPGNVRELRNVIRRAATLAYGAPIDRELLLGLDEATAQIQLPEGLAREAPSIPPGSLAPSGHEDPAATLTGFELPLAEATEVFRRSYVEQLRRRFGDDLQRAAAHAGTHPKSVSRLFRHYRVY